MTDAPNLLYAMSVGGASSWVKQKLYTAVPTVVRIGRCESLVIVDLDFET